MSWSSPTTWGPSVPVAADQWLRSAGVVYVNTAVGFQPPPFGVLAPSFCLCAPVALQDVAPCSLQVPWKGDNPLYEVHAGGHCRQSLHSGVVVQGPAVAQMAPNSAYTPVPAFLERKPFGLEDFYAVQNGQLPPQTDLPARSPPYTFQYSQEQTRYPEVQEQTRPSYDQEQSRYSYDKEQSSFSRQQMPTHEFHQSSNSDGFSPLRLNAPKDQTQPNRTPPGRNKSQSVKDLYPNCQVVQTANKKSSKHKKQKNKSPVVSDQETLQVYKQHFERQMQDFISSTFPDLLTSVVTVPPLHFNKTRYKRLDRHSTNLNEVVQQLETQLSDVSGDKTDDIVIQCIVRVVKAKQEPVIVLTNYVFDNYLCKTVKEVERRAQQGLQQAVSAYEAPNRDSDPKEGLEEVSQHGDSIPNLSGARKRGSCSSSHTKSVGRLQAPRSAKNCLNPKEVFPTPSDLTVDLRRGDFDILVISRKFGFVIIETKSMDSTAELGASSCSRSQGCQPSQSQSSEGEEEDEEKEAWKEMSDQGKAGAATRKHNEDREDIPEPEVDTTLALDRRKELDMLRNKISKALQQLKKEEEVLRHLVSDFPEADCIPVKKVLAFPKTRKALLRSILEDCNLTAEVCESLAAPSLERALSSCLCAEDARKIEEAVKMAPWESGETALADESLLRWWSNVIDDNDKTEASCCSAMQSTGSRDAISQETYEGLFARFCGPYSKVAIECRKSTRDEARTVADCIHLTGIRFGRSILRDNQMQILDSEERFICLTGPPGSGKTLVLGLKAVEWARAGHRVVIIGAHKLRFGALVSWTLFRQVQENALEALTNVSFEKISLRTDAETFARHLLNKYKGAGLKIFIDECPWMTTMKEQETRLLSCIDDLKAITDLYQNILEMYTLSDFTVPRPVRTPNPSPPASEKRASVEISNKNHQSACNKTRKTKQEHDGRSAATSRDPNNEVVGNVEFSEDTAAAASKMNGFYYRRSQSRYDAGLLPTQMYFKKMESHMRHAEKRISFLRTGTAGPRLMSMDNKWGGLVLQIANEHEQIMALKTEAEDRLCGSHATQVDVEGITGVLDEVDKRMLSAMGFLFHFNTSLYFFLIQKLMQAITRLQKEEENLDVALWTSSAFSTEIPKAFAEKKLELSLRCPPAVQELLIHLEPDLIIEQSPPRYTYQTRTFEVNPPLPTVGPEVMLLDHGDHVTSVKEVNDCPTCGQALADYLLGTLRVGACAGSLRPRDVTICGSPVHSERCALLEQLRQRGLPLLMESELDPTPPSFPDKVLVIGGNYLQGLESKIVVYVPEVNRVPLNEDDGKMQEGGDVSPDCPDWVQRLGRWNRSYLWFVASRTLSHLIVFKI